MARFRLWGHPCLSDPANGFLAVVVAGNPEIFRTADGGHTWTMTNSAGPDLIAGAELTAVDFIDPTHWAVADGSRVATTADAGKSWRLGLGQGLPAGHFVKLAFVNQSVGYGLFQPTGDAQYYLYRTEGVGDQWNLVYGAS